MDHVEVLSRDGSEAFLTQSWWSNEPRKVRGITKWEDPEDVPLRIGIVGAHGVGKTTLAKALSSQLEIPRIDELARTVHGLGFPLNQKTNMMAQFLMWLGQLYEELTLDEFVADRTLMDVMCYTDHRVNQSKGQSKNRYFLNAMSNVTYEIISNQYSVILYVPIEFKIRADGVRDTDTEYQKAIDELVVRYLHSFNVDFFPVTGSKDRRVASVMKYLKQSGLLSGR